MKQAVVLPLMSILLCCLLVSPSAAVDLEPLKQRYLACAHESTERRLATGELATCSQVGEQLLQQGFGGDLDRLLAWWRMVRQPPTFDQAQIHYEAGHYGQAYAAFAVLADCGHREAARIALQMRQFGPALYGTAFMAGPRQLQRWRALLDRPEAVAAAATCTGAADAARRRGPEPASPGHRRAPADPGGEPWRHHGVG